MALKYKRLSNAELGELKKDFIDFLASQSITAPDWQKMISDEPDRCHGIIEVFSDIVYEKSLERIKCLEIKKDHHWQVMFFSEDTAEMIALQLPEDSKYSFTSPRFNQMLSAGKVTLEGMKTEVFTGKKSYKEERSMEVFLEMEKGGVPANEALWILLKKLVPQIKE
ncbi:MAG: DUF6495 family protein [Flavobacteriales bacterium]